jgi:hypothetical protein
MKEAAGKLERVHLSLKEKVNLVLPYVGRKIMEQIKAVALIVVYLVLFQVVALRIPIADAAIIASGIAVIVLGLAFFMEGLFLGLMPLGETIGIRLPQKTKLPVILIFSFILGVGVTFAEPAIGVLQVAGSFIKAWNAPLLFVVLNKYAMLLKITVGAGVGLAVLAGMLRFFYNWSLKPFLYIGVPVTMALSIWATFEPNLAYLSGVAWDCGGVTTGPVTVPLVLALGIGVSRMTSKDGGEAGGFGVVTLASLFPIVTVFLLGIILLPSVPAPMDQKAFLASENRAKAVALFDSEDALFGYALRNASIEAQSGLWDGDKTAMLSYVAKLGSDEGLRTRVLGKGDTATLERWAIGNGSQEQRVAALGSEEAVRAAVARVDVSNSSSLDLPDLLARNGAAAVQAILPLVIFLVFVLAVVLREKLPHPDQLFIGVVFALIGMGLFSIGIELGLSKLGNQVGSKLPSTFKRIELTEQQTTISGFDKSIIQTAVNPDGSTVQFFYANLNDAYVQVPWDEKRFEDSTGRYQYVPTHGPLYGETMGVGGILIVIFFAFVMGFGATLAEPALNALGQTVEVLTVGAFRKSLLMQTVAIGVGIGIAVGVMKIVFDIPLIFILAPPYAVLMLLTKLSSEEFVNIGWDSAGVTTGPITVPLVLAMGLGISTQVGVVEGFGILAAASAFPILAVLAVGLVTNSKKKALLEAAGA